MSLLSMYAHHRLAGTRTPADSRKDPRPGCLYVPHAPVAALPRQDLRGFRVSPKMFGDRPQVAELRPRLPRGKLLMGVAPTKRVGSKWAGSAVIDRRSRTLSSPRAAMGSHRSIKRASEDIKAFHFLCVGSVSRYRSAVRTRRGFFRCMAIPSQ